MSPDRVETVERADGATEHRVYRGGRLVEKRVTAARDAAPYGRVMWDLLESA